MPGSLGPLGLVPQGLALVCAVAIVLVLALIALGRRRAPLGPARSSFELEDAAARDEAAALRQELAEVRRRLEETERLLVAIPECTKELVTVGLEEPEIANASARQVKSLLTPDLVAFFRLDPGTGLLQLASGAGLPGGLGPPPDGPGMTVRVGEGKVGLAAQHRTLVDEARYRYERQQLPDGDEEGPAGFVADLAAPVVFGDRLLGVIAIRGSRQPADYQRWLLQMVAELTAVSIHTARTRVRVEAQATTDALTGLHNRTYLATRLAEEFRRAESYGAPLSVILFDVDHFKHYNDRNGHPAGDACLKAVAAVTRRVVRATHSVVRYGGEEFLVLAPGTGLEDALTEAERIRAAVEAAQVAHAQAQPLGRLSVSVGVAAYPVHGQTGEALVQAADAALYRSKQAGRNCVTAASMGFLTEDTEAQAQGGHRA